MFYWEHCWSAYIKSSRLLGKQPAAAQPGPAQVAQVTRHTGVQERSDGWEPLPHVVRGDLTELIGCVFTLPHPMLLFWPLTSVFLIFIHFHINSWESVCSHQPSCSSDGDDTRQICLSFLRDFCIQNLTFFVLVTKMSCIPSQESSMLNKLILNRI